MNAIFLAVKALVWYRGRTVILLLAIALTLWMPLTVRMVLGHFETALTQRAAETPLVVGPIGARTDLALHALYFQSEQPGMMTMSELDYIDQTGYAAAVPLHVRFRTQGTEGAAGAPIVGTSVDYFLFRNLRIAAGQPLTQLGDCVVGAVAARRLGVNPGDSLISAPRNALDLAGDYPLKMNVAGILLPTNSPDDEAVFVDMKTVWVIEGIGHGHLDVEEEAEADGSRILENRPDRVIAGAAVLPFLEITDENRDSFHFHGDPADFPVSAVLALPEATRGRILLQGRYLDGDRGMQCFRPIEVMNELLAVVLRIRRLVDTAFLVAGGVTALLIGLVVLLSLKLRQPELKTLYRMGAPRLLIIGTQCWEFLLILLLSAAVAVCAAWVSQNAAEGILRNLLF